MVNEAYHTAITVMPNGMIFEGEHASASGYPRAPLLGRYVFGKKEAGKPKLVAKTQLFKRELNALAAKVQTTPYGYQLSGADTEANKSNLSNIQLIRLFPQLQGTPERFFWLGECFVERDVPQLELREAYRNVTGGVKRLKRLEEADSAFTTYDEITYNLSKLAENVYTPIEDMMRTVINPQEVDLEQVRFAMDDRRNNDALAALEAMGDAGYSFPNLDAPDTIGPSAFHSTNKSVSQLREMFVDFRKDNHVIITHVAMNSNTLDKLALNTWTLRGGPTGMDPIRLVGGGVVPLPGIPNVSCVVDDVIADNKIYAFNKPFALRKGEGPKIMRRFYDEYRHAEAISVLDFNQYLSADAQLSEIATNFGGEIAVNPS